MNRPGDLESISTWLVRWTTKIFCHQRISKFYFVSNTIVCNPQKKTILKSICLRCNNSKLTRIFKGPPNIDPTTQNANMGGPLDHPWFLLILHTAMLVNKDFLRNVHVKIHVSQQRFSNLVSDWLAGQCQSIRSQVWKSSLVVQAPGWLLGTHFTENVFFFFMHAKISSHFMA